MENLINKKIPNLELEVYHEDRIKKIKLSNYRGKWLICFFYPADFTFVCPTELEEMAEYYPQFKKIGVEVLSISTDTVFTHKAWHDQSPSIKKIKFPMAADPSGKFCRALGTYIETEGVSLRASFIIDPRGFIKAYEICDNNIGRNAGELLRKTQAAIFVTQHKGQVCPASWQPGKKTFKPDLKMVGKI